MAKTILTIDDSPSVRSMVRMTLSGAGYEVIEAADGQEGLDQALAKKPTAVLTDMTMPRMNGMEFIKAYRARPESRGVPVVVLSTESDNGLIQQAKAAGATGWLVKPFKQDQLINVVRKVAGA